MALCMVTLLGVVCNCCTRTLYLSCWCLPVLSVADSVQDMGFSLFD